MNHNQKPSLVGHTHDYEAIFVSMRSLTVAARNGFRATTVRKWSLAYTLMCLEIELVDIGSGKDERLTQDHLVTT
jgi:hypothetical protein